MTTSPDENTRLQARLSEALDAIRSLRAENERLRRQLNSGQPESTPPTSGSLMKAESTSGGVDAHSTESTKVALFRSLFRAREDVYAYRWDGRDGRSGYSPALRPGARRQKGQRPDPKVLLPLDDEVVQSHLLGRQVVGVYPLLEDETCPSVKCESR